MNMDPTFEVTVYGTYAAQREHGQGREVTPYGDVKLRLPLSKLERTVGICKRKFLPMILTKLDPKFLRVRTVFVKEAVPVDGNNSGVNFDYLPEDVRIRLYSRSQLETFIISKRLPISVAKYPTLQSLKEATQMAINSPEVFKKRKQKTEQDSGDMADLLKLNPELVTGASASAASAASTEIADKEEIIKQLKQFGVKGVNKKWSLKKLEEKLLEFLDKSEEVDEIEELGENLIEGL